ncbi:hypothetical protein H3N56_11570 [Cetobacterium sp. 2A]|uniref:hypothetical protein n=1 Tax=Cetobacterium sp. 2A TaxID=2754723 RepID=UPI00163C72FD|nr:hypothetical protein [Cetobacterium sp. 2A]MBC2857071.1 hypothetical protein [Cetobacterium sp. 2A]
MLKLRNIIIIILSLFIVTGCFKSDEEKRQDKVNKILNHMEKEYGEKFYMSSPFGGRGQNDDLRILVKPLRYKGTPKEYDNFYEDYAFIKTDGKTGDGFGTVYLKEGAEEYFKPKLRELFGENILVAIEPEGYYEKWNFKEEMNRRKQVYDNYPEGKYSPLSGGIYIFGRVESESDREYYRKQIYEFIQYLKAENMFDYVDIYIAIIDERMLLPNAKQRFLQGESHKELNFNQSKALLNKQLSLANKEFELMTQVKKNEKLNSFNRSSDFKRISGVMLSTKIASPKFVGNFFRQDLVDEIFDGKKEYDKLEDVKFTGLDYRKW